MVCIIVYVTIQKLLFNIIKFLDSVYWDISAETVENHHCSPLNVCIITRFLNEADGYMLQSETALVM